MAVLQSDTKNTNYEWTFLLERIGLYGFVFTLLLPIRINIPFLGLLLISFIVNKRFGQIWKTLSSSSIYKWIVIYFSLLILSLVYSDDIYGGLKALEIKLVLVLLPVLLSGISGIEKDRRQIIISFILGIVTASLYSIFSTIIVYQIDFTDWSYFSWVLPETINLNASQYSIYIVCALFFLIAEQLEGRLFNNAIAAIMGTYLLGFLAFMSSRLALALFVLMTVTYLFKLMFKSSDLHKKRSLLIIISSIVVFVFLSFLYIPYLNDRIMQLIVGFGEDPRRIIFISSLEIAKENLFFGAGIGDVQSLLNTQYERFSFQIGLINNFTTHNDFLYSLLSAGLPGIIALLTVYFLYFKNYLVNKNILSIAFPMFFFIAAQSEAILNRHKGVLLFIFLICITCINPIFKKQSDA